MTSRLDLQDAILWIDTFNQQKEELLVFLQRLFSNQAIADYLVTNGYTISCKEFCREANIVCEEFFFSMYFLIEIF